MRLPGALAKEIQEGMLSAFTSKDTLTQLLRFHFDERLDAITTGGSLNATVFELVAWAESTNNVESLLKAALAENPNNPALQSALASFRQFQGGSETSNSQIPGQAADRAQGESSSQAQRSLLLWTLSIIGVVAAVSFGILNSGYFPRNPPERSPGTTAEIATSAPTATPTPSLTPAPTATSRPTLRPMWIPTPGWSALSDVQIDNDVHAIVVHEDDVYVGGQFTLPFPGLVGWNYRSKSWSQVGQGLTGAVQAAVMIEDDLYIGGRFTIRNGEDNIVASGLARWDGTEWHAVGGMNFSQDIHALAADVDGSLYVGGRFRYMSVSNSDQSASGIVRWTGEEWQALGEGADTGIFISSSHDCPNESNQVHAVAVHDGYVYVGGSFSNIAAPNDGKIPDSGNFARWHIESEEWEGIGRLGNNVCQPVHSIAAYRDEIYVGGAFYYITTLEDLSIRNVNMLARWNPSDKQWVALRSIDPYDRPSQSGSRGTIGIINAMAASSKGLYIGGRFIFVDNIARNNIVLFDAGAWKTLDNGVMGDRGQVNALAVQDGHLFIGGNFSSTGDLPNAFIAIWGEE